MKLSLINKCFSGEENTPGWLSAEDDGKTKASFSCPLLACRMPVLSSKAQEWKVSHLKALFSYYDAQSHTPRFNFSHKGIRILYHSNRNEFLSGRHSGVGLLYTMHSFLSQEIQGPQKQPLQAKPDHRMISREHCQNCGITR